MTSPNVHAWVRRVCVLFCVFVCVRATELVNVHILTELIYILYKYELKIRQLRFRTRPTSRAGFRVCICSRVMSCTPTIVRRPSNTTCFRLVRMCIYVYVYTYMYICMYVHTSNTTCFRLVRICTYVYVYIYMYIHVCVHRLSSDGPPTL